MMDRTRLSHCRDVQFFGIVAWVSGTGRAVGIKWAVTAGPHGRGRQEDCSGRAGSSAFVLQLSQVLVRVAASGAAAVTVP